MTVLHFLLLVIYAFMRLWFWSLVLLDILAQPPPLLKLFHIYSGTHAYIFHIAHQFSLFWYKLDRHCPGCLNLVLYQSLVCCPYLLLGFLCHYVAVSFHTGDFLVCSLQFLLSHRFHRFVVSLSFHICFDLIDMQHSAQIDQ